MEVKDRENDGIGEECLTRDDKKKIKGRRNIREIGGQKAKKKREWKKRKNKRGRTHEKKECISR